MHLKLVSFWDQKRPGDAIKKLLLLVVYEKKSYQKRTIIFVIRIISMMIQMILNDYVTVRLGT